MAITPGLTEATAKTFFSTLKEVGTDKAVSEALIGGAVGVGSNLAYNTVSGDSGGYTGAALLGGAVGGLGRAGLKHFNLEDKAANLVSTFKSGAVGGLTQAKNVAGSKSQTAPSAQRIMKGRQESPIKDYIKAEEKALKQGNRLMDEGYISQGQEQIDLSTSYGLQRKNLQADQFKHQTKNMSPGEIEDKYASQGGSKYIKDNLDPNFRSIDDRLRDNTVAANSMRNGPKPKTSGLGAASTGGASSSAGRGSSDEHYADALDFMVKSGKASSTGLQKQFNIGYNRASSMMDAFEVDGIVSAASKNGKRNLLL